MPKFSYIVQNDMGKTIDGEIIASNIDEVTQSLSMKGYTVLEVRKKAATTNLPFLKGKVKAKDISLFCRQLAIILDAGIPIANALSVLIEQSSNKVMERTISGIYDGIQRGISLSKSMRQYSHIFPEILCSMVESGEVTGQMDKVFNRMATQFEKDGKLRKKIKGAMNYPIIVASIAAGVVAVLMIKVVPVFKDVLEDMNVELPALTSGLIMVSNFFVNFWWLLLLIIVGGVIGGKKFSRTYSGKVFFGKLAITIPIISNLTKNIMTARYARTLAALLSSGVLLIQGLEVTRKIMGNVLVMDMMDHLIEEIKKGNGMSVPMKELRYFPPMMISMIRIGEESGQLDETLDKCADYYEQEVEASIQTLTSLIEPLIIVFLAMVVGTIIASIMLPMLKVYESLSQ